MIRNMKTTMLAQTKKESKTRSDNQFRYPAEEDSPNSDETQPEQNTSQETITQYGIHNTENIQQPRFQPQYQQQQQPETHQQIPYQQPIHYYQPQHAYQQSNYPPGFIDDDELFYDGNQFFTFLRKYEQAADWFGSTKFQRALQIGRFIRSEKHGCELEDMDGYKGCDWDTLQTEMIETWGAWGDEMIQYLEKFTTILKYLVKNKHINKEDNPGLLFLRAFSTGIQQSIKRTLVSKDQLPKAKDGNNKAPLWEHLVDAAETEMQRIEEGCEEENIQAWELASLKHRLEITSTGTCKYPQPSNQLEFPEGPITENTEPEIDCAEPPIDCVDAVMDFMEPVVEVTETDLENHSQESVPETTALTIHLTNQKPSTSYFMDTVMELKHTVIEILEFDSNGVNTAISVNQEEILDQSVQQIKTFNHQPHQLNNNYKSKIEDSHLRETTQQDPQFLCSPEISWIEHIHKIQSKIFNKHLFKPHLDQHEEFFNKPLPQEPGTTDADTEEKDNNPISLCNPNIKTPDFKPASAHTSINPIPIPMPAEEIFKTPPAPVLPDIQSKPTQLIKLQEYNLQTKEELEESTKNLSQLQSHKNQSLLVFYLLKKLIFQPTLKIPPDRFGQLQEAFNHPRLLVGIG
ncbi:hypothetical protein PTTG_26960 [Puccinia triticina 1-1 BBBD Race 1]|uniref:Uncharacterized protein n=1 Tax=Puccinia triticina (isolate 1-1 / race 1 (BBBD)) TaxID=630390 RepID=A0A180GQ72_PUCT1|nr:hypothetical protein PTTG_26960 [Puccinia triticina 1-1 BBBD Race 1]